MFLGKASYYRRFIHHFSHRAAPLRRLLAKDYPFKWDEKAEEAFRDLKAAIWARSVLAHPDFQSPHPFVIDSDASGHGIGAVLSQKQEDGHERPIAYFWRSLLVAERNYCVHWKELLAIVCAIQHWRYFLLVKPFLVRTDHQSLKWLMTCKAISGQLARWCEALSDYDFTIDY